MENGCATTMVMIVAQCYKANSFVFGCASAKIEAGWWKRNGSQVVLFSLGWQRRSCSLWLGLGCSDLVTSSLSWMETMVKHAWAASPVLCGGAKGLLAVQVEESMPPSALAVCEAEASQGLGQFACRCDALRPVPV